MGYASVTQGLFSEGLISQPPGFFCRGTLLGLFVGAFAVGFGAILWVYAVELQRPLEMPIMPLGEGKYRHF